MLIPSALGMMTGRPPRSTAAAELDVPRSMPMMFMNSPELFLLPFIQSYQIGVCEHVALHGLFQRGLGGVTQIRQHGIERIQLEKIAVPADRRTGPAVAGAAPVVDSLQGSGRK